MSGHNNDDLFFVHQIHLREDKQKRLPDMIIIDQMLVHFRSISCNIFEKQIFFDGQSKCEWYIVGQTMNSVREEMSGFRQGVFLTDLL